ncbi:MULTISPECIES: radical SAM protein [unclassified Streptomyces]|uniref:B12-binding domain-containing radical SAM protein n=1 Tax=unclassified Streptomyces TaxID=2593676 RepID=UPI0009393B1B|nr:radical SAM protein [Streptomyces sp. TSRI0281]OKI45318.1 radical SAM protein [Streptomyces sp. TSRI0281]
MSQLQHEIGAIRSREIHLVDPYGPKDTDGLLRMVFMIPYGHAFSLMGNGPMSLHDLINRSQDIPAVAERALHYDCLIRDGNRLSTPDGEPYRSIESALPVATADVIGVSVINSGSLHSVFQQLDLAGVPRRSADRIPGHHPIIVGGNSGLADPEPMADYLDIIALGEAEESLPELLRVVHAHHSQPDAGVSLHEKLARIPGLYVPSLYTCEYLPGGGVSTVTPKKLTVPAKAHTAYIPVKDLPPAHWVYPKSDGTAAGIHPTIGCRHACDFCNLGVPPFRHAPLDMLTDYIDRLETHKIRRIIISSPTFTQYRYRSELLDHISAYARRASAIGETVTTIIGSIRADELTQDYLESVTELGEFGHLFTELQLDQARGIITIAPEWASPDLVAMWGKTQRRERVDNAIDLCRRSNDINTVMLYFIVGAPGERESDRLAIADYARDVLDRLGHPDGTVIVKLTQFMPKPGTASQRMRMADPDLVHTYTSAIEARLRHLVGDEEFQQHFRILDLGASHMHLEVISLRGDRRIGLVLEELYDAGIDLHDVTKDQLVASLARHGLDYDRHLRHMDEPVLPWHTLNHVNPAAEQQLAVALYERESTPR